MGWRAYACNAPQEKLGTLDAVQCYRNEYRIEHKFDELLTRVTALMPVYLNTPNRIKALIRLLLLALKYVSLIEMQVRTKLADTAQELKELYPQLNKKNWGEILKGKLIDLGISEILNREAIELIFKELTDQVLRIK